MKYEYNDNIYDLFVFIQVQVKIYDADNSYTIRRL